MSISKYTPPIGWVDPASYPGIDSLSKKWQIIVDELSKAISLDIPWLHFTDDDSVAALSARSQQEVEALIRPRLVPLAAPAPHKLLPLLRERQAFLSARQLCPETVNLIESFPAAINAAFAALEAGGKIDRHQGSSNLVDRCHLGLIIPSGDAALSVSNIPRTWDNGQLLIFDDRAFHEAWNRTEERRVVLIVDLEKDRSVNRRGLPGGQA
ncbi:aspartyl/asparaginyl beta-hydroxylase domain-containing protein [Burkholderia sp. BCC0405]|uniref:aspartyl/asparaginyl beta-hydroxylase domain-containing protein n=1 Tax=Burkholderia sp. BCC0405 TaxID=2676298 RepID=UPI00158F5CF3|nr:aspartyl/asparaginyl beta-hydroxylase domain-containing protein [Burkholderia sp. BCC0405]